MNLSCEVNNLAWSTSFFSIINSTLRAFASAFRHECYYHIGIFSDLPVPLVEMAGVVTD